MKYCRFALICSFLLIFPADVCGVDRDDDVKIENGDSIAYAQTAPTDSDAVEAKFPDEAKDIRAAHAKHVQNAVRKDIDAYMNDFNAERMRYPELEREYAQRAMNLKNLQIEVKAIEFSELTRTSATIHTRQITQYDDDSGIAHIDDAIISYRWIRSGSDPWKIAFTERRRLTAQ